MDGDGMPAMGLLDGEGMAGLDFVQVGLLDGQEMCLEVAGE